MKMSHWPPFNILAPNSQNKLVVSVMYITQ